MKLTDIKKPDDYLNKLIKFSEIENYDVKVGESVTCTFDEYVGQINVKLTSYSFWDQFPIEYLTEIKNAGPDYWISNSPRYELINRKLYDLEINGKSYYRPGDNARPELDRGVRVYVYNGSMERVDYKTFDTPLTFFTQDNSYVDEFTDFLISSAQHDYIFITMYDGFYSNDRLRTVMGTIGSTEWNSIHDYITDDQDEPIFFNKTRAGYCCVIKKGKIIHESAKPSTDPFLPKASLDVMLDTKTVGTIPVKGKMKEGSVYTVYRSEDGWIVMDGPDLGPSLKNGSMEYLEMPVNTNLLVGTSIKNGDSYLMAPINGSGGAKYIEYDSFHENITVCDYFNLIYLLSITQLDDKTLLVNGHTEEDTTTRMWRWDIESRSYTHMSSVTDIRCALYHGGYVYVGSSADQKLYILNVDNLTVRHVLDIGIVCICAISIDESRIFILSSQPENRNQCLGVLLDTKSLNLFYVPSIPMLPYGVMQFDHEHLFILNRVAGPDTNHAAVLNINTLETTVYTEIYERFDDLLRMDAHVGVTTLNNGNVVVVPRDTNYLYEIDPHSMQVVSQARKPDNSSFETSAQMRTGVVVSGNLFIGNKLLRYRPIGMKSVSKEYLLNSKINRSYA